MPSSKRATKDGWRCKLIGSSVGSEAEGEGGSRLRAGRDTSWSVDGQTEFSRRDRDEGWDGEELETSSRSPTFRLGVGLRTCAEYSPRACPEW